MERGIQAGTVMTGNRRTTRSLPFGLTHVGAGLSCMGLHLASKVLEDVVSTKTPKAMADLIWECRTSRHSGFGTSE